MEKLIKIEYVGNKPTSHDNVARSGKVWNGKGDIQEVTEAQAKTLLKYPDQWALVDEEDQEKADKEIFVEVPDEHGVPVKINVDDLTGPLEKMSKIELVAFVKMKWGRDMPHDLTKKQMLGEIETFEAELG